MSRRLTILLAAALSAAPAVAETNAPRVDGRFVNPYVESPHGGFFGYLHTRLFGDETWASYDPERDGPVPQAQPRLAAPDATLSNATVTWIGHSTVLIQHRGVNVLTDPILTNYASPLSFLGPRRQSPPALPIDELPRIDAVMISHNHYDHLDAPTIRALGSGPRYFVPLGLRAWLIGRGVNGGRIEEMDWWERRNVDFGGTPLEIIATPSQHFSGRSLTDRNETLWAAWAIRWDDFSLWFGGDTGYNHRQFKVIGARFGSFDLGIIPIGAYLPRSFMRTVHVNPGEAVDIHRDIRARQSMGVHWGTFELAAEHLLEPPRALERAVEAAGLPPEAFTTFAVGESRSFPADR